MMRNLKGIKLKTGRIVGMAVALVAMLAFVSGSRIDAQIEQLPEEAESQEQSDEDAIIGTYDEQMVFQQYPDRNKLQEAQMEAQEQMQEAQENGDQQKIQQIQMDFQQKQQEIIEDFESTIEEALPEVAEEAGVKVIATQVSYTAEGMGTKDITSKVVKAIGGEPEAEQPLPENIPEE